MALPFLTARPHELLIPPAAPLPSAARACLPCCCLQTATFALLYNMGQCCAAGTRLYVHADIYDNFVAKYIKSFKAW